MEVVDVDEPSSPGVGEVLIAPDAVGLCGSDFHYFTGDIGTIDDPSSLYPRIQGHEIAATIVEVGEACPPHLSPGMRVAVWPVNGCGACYPCSLGRENACVSISLTGIHSDGALQERLLLPATQVFAVGDQDPALAALVEPVSIAMRAMARGRVVAGERVVILGAGPIGQALALAATDRGAATLLIDRLEQRLAFGVAFGAEVLQAGADDEVVAAVRSGRAATGLRSSSRRPASRRSSRRGSRWSQPPGASSSSACRASMPRFAWATCRSASSTSWARAAAAPTTSPPPSSWSDDDARRPPHW